MTHSACSRRWQRTLEAHEPAAKLIAERRPLVRDDPAALRPLLVQLLSGPCKWANDGGKPLLLLVDDLERVLEADPAGGRHRVQTDVRPVLAALLHAFDAAAQPQPTGADQPLSVCPWSRTAAIWPTGWPTWS